MSLIYSLLYDKNKFIECRMWKKMYFRATGMAGGNV